MNPCYTICFLHSSYLIFHSRSYHLAVVQSSAFCSFSVTQGNATPARCLVAVTSFTFLPFFLRISGFILTIRILQFIHNSFCPPNNPSRIYRLFVFYSYYLNTIPLRYFLDPIFTCLFGLLPILGIVLYPVFVKKPRNFAFFKPFSHLPLFGIIYVIPNFSHATIETIKISKSSIGSK
jgi:hypothetical protein